ncbi:MAG: tetratricopeptide repeat protein [Planctomycetota bacterium]|nr:tetratricopeptide repeat protein [Planctomycetota bacterium]
MDERIEKVRLLIGHERYKEALERLTSILSEDPENRQALFLQSIALQNMEHWKLALQSSKTLVTVAPDWSWSHHRVASVLNGIDKERKALPFAHEALRLDPEEPDHFALLAYCHSGLDDWKSMLQAAENGLRLDPEDQSCTLLRSHALRLLNRRDEAGSAIERLGELSPNDPDVHNSMGWLCLQDGRPTEAMNHFREALRLDPDDGGAREGLAEALKGQNILYRPILAWYMLSARLGQKGSMALILGLWFGMRLLEHLPGPDWIPISLFVVYFLFVWLSWVGSSLFDLLLYLRRDLRDILAKRERTGAQMLGISLLCGILLAPITLVFGKGLVSALVFGVFFLVGIPISGAIGMPNAKSRMIGNLIAASAFLMAMAGTLFVLSEPRFDPELQPPVYGYGPTLLSISLIISLLSTLAMTGLGLVPEGRGKR